MQTRREFLKSLTQLGATALCLKALPSWALTPLMRNSEDHFFVEILVRGGWDTHYFLDSRPLAMTAAGIAHDYYGKEPFLWTGTNGNTLWASEIARPLQSLQQYFSVVNGVVMSDGPDGHGQVLNTWFTGNLLGGKSFIPDINKHANSGKKQSIDAIQRENLPQVFSNHDRVVVLNSKSAFDLTAKIKNSPSLDSKSPTFNFIKSRFENDDALLNAWTQTPLMKSSFSNVILNAPAPNMKQTEELEYMMGVAFEYFKNGLSRGALLMTTDASDFFFDTHLENTAKKHPSNMANVVDMLSRLINQLRNTEYSPGVSFLDVTTLVVSSEFSRTLRQTYATLDKTGTDHNAFNNTVLIGGKGIKGGMVIGASDYQSASETLSKAHLHKDSKKIKLMGKVFDYAQQSISSQSPDEFKIENYISCAAVVNTLLSAFEVDPEFFRKAGSTKPVLTTFLS